ncbi:MAG: hypothetical protein QOH63_1938 [Acidobacteriota bacterium]|jgi:PHD/YefM family antitoxin component YafN of YafNO toxin-antitoxin module|nr:hypothetical protein [Acidobacteriota bacterium]
MIDLKDVGYLSASKFTRLSVEKIEQLSPVTILLDGDKPVSVVINYKTYIQMQADYTSAALSASEAASWKRRAAQHGCNTEEGDHGCG